MLMGNLPTSLKGNHGLPTLFRPAQARALAAELGEEGQHAAHCSEIGAILQAALSVCEHSLTYTCERRKFFNSTSYKNDSKRLPSR